MLRSALKITQNIAKFNQTPKVLFSNKWNDKETAEEAIYFSKQDAELMKQLLNKLDAHQSVNQGMTDSFRDRESRDLKTVLERFHVKQNDALVEELLQWKLK